MTLPSALDALDVIDKATLRVARLAGFTGAAAGAIAMAMIEAVTNAIVHGNRLDPDKTVSVRYRWKPGLFAAEVHDEGGGFDLSCVYDPTDPERCMACSGRGIFIMRQIMDSVDFEMDDARGTTVTMTKTR
jgi:serine/threonine-protein kinase RsbW